MFEVGAGDVVVGAEGSIRGGGRQGSWLGLTSLTVHLGGGSSQGWRHRTGAREGLL